MYVTRGMEGVIQNVYRLAQGERSITLHVYVLPYTVCFHVFVLWCLVATVTISIRLFFTTILCIYTILDKGCHILYVFGLNSSVCSTIVGVHLSSDSVTYYFMMDADLYNSYLLHLRIKRF